MTKQVQPIGSGTYIYPGYRAYLDLGAYNTLRSGGSHSACQEPGNNGAIIDFVGNVRFNCILLNKTSLLCGYFAFFRLLYSNLRDVEVAARTASGTYKAGEYLIW